jgi:uncharacterized protein YlxW (UPF0749 family)
METMKKEICSQKAEIIFLEQQNRSLITDCNKLRNECKKYENSVNHLKDKNLLIEDKLFSMKSEVDIVILSFLLYIFIKLFLIRMIGVYFLLD